MTTNVEMTVATARQIDLEAFERDGYAIVDRGISGLVEPRMDGQHLADVDMPRRVVDHARAEFYAPLSGTHLFTLENPDDLISAEAVFVAP